MGGWGDGEMGRFGDGEMGGWGDGEIRRWRPTPNPSQERNLGNVGRYLCKVIIELSIYILNIGFYVQLTGFDIKSRRGERPFS
ncbi:MAG: hypothetical protein F6K23_18770 [Okeania sp. SIO2C9]|uniref:hypothetical protein n=1 Tax=Okeania sp. SIO2C9 TaxID=2607791 RepID=UPI0013C138C3|nr:hypothetical protein [Okeania sp. SIO2C9]NEQ74905.1 hypothetical protein [Okeania sp. SIO2C9]